MKKILSFFGGTIWIILIGSVVFLNYFSGIIASVWLALLGHWNDIVFAIFLGFIMPLAYTIITLPTMFAGRFVLGFIQKNNILIASILSFIISFYEKIIIVFWVYFVFSHFLSHATLASYIPFLLLGYATTLGPLVYMANKEPQSNKGTLVGLFLAMMSNITLIIMWLTIGINFSILIILVVIFSVFNLLLAIPMMKNHNTFVS